MILLYDMVCLNKKLQIAREMLCSLRSYAEFTQRSRVYNLSQRQLFQYRTG